MSWTKILPAKTTKVKDGPGIWQGNWEVMEDWSEGEHCGLANTSPTPGIHKAGECSILKVDTTTNILALTDVASAVAFDTTLDVFKYNDGTADGWINLGGLIETGTQMVFYQDTAPLGWTLLVLDDKLLYITKGSVAGGETGGTDLGGSWSITGFAGETEAHILTVEELPSHSHNYYKAITLFATFPQFTASRPHLTTKTSYVGGDIGHQHTISSTLTQDGTWRPSAYNFIICSKD